MRKAAPLHGSLSQGKLYSELVKADSVSFDRTSDEGIEARSFAGAFTRHKETWNR